jgi:glucose-6-phosphate 1-epimerase
LDAPYTVEAMSLDHQTSTELNERFGLPGVLLFEDHGELVRARISLPTCEASIYLQGAHLTHWQPAGQQPVLFLSERSAFTPGKAIRGGVPICFPWFGARSDGLPGPSHGFARIQPWQLAFAALLPDTGEGDRLQLTFVLGPTDLSRSVGFDHFRIAYEVMLGSTLSSKLTVANLGTDPFHFEEALHAYYHVADVRKTRLGGLESARYLDKRDAGKEKSAPAVPLTLTEFSDRVFFANSAPLTIDDPGNGRRIHIEKQHSATTVVWNPWPEGSASLADLGPEDWPHFLCVEAANTATEAITLAPGEAHFMTTMITLRKND